MVEEDLELNEKYLERNYSDSCLESINNALSTPIIKNLEEETKITDKLKLTTEQENMNLRKKIYDEQGWMIKFTEAFDSMLCSNLIINKDSNMLILKPFHGWQIINCLRNAPNNVKNEIIEKLNWLIGKLHINSFILTNKSSLRNFKTDINFNFVLELIEILIENNRDYLLSEKILRLIGKIIYFSGLKSRYIKYILKKILNLFTNYDGNIFILLIKLLNIIFGKTIHDGKHFPERYFYFNNFNSDLKVKTETLQINNFSLSKGYSIIMWVRFDSINRDASNSKIVDNSILYYIHFSKYTVIELHLKKNHLYYKISIENKEETPESEQSLDYLCEIEFGKWTFLSFVHKIGYFLHKPEFINKIYKNNDIVSKNIDYPKLNNEKIISIGFGKNFTGLISNIMMISDAISINCVKFFQEFNFGLYNEKNLRIFRNYIISENSNPINLKLINELKAYLDQILFLYSPSRVKDSIVIDCINTNHAVLNVIVESKFLVGGVFFDKNYQNNIKFLGGISILLPIFEFISTSKLVRTDILEESLNLITIIIDGKENNKANFIEEKFFKLLGHFFEKYEKNLFTKEIQVLFIKIGDKLTENKTDMKLAKHYFKSIIFNPKIFMKFEIDIQIELWKLVSDLYIKKIEVMIEVFNAMNILELIIKVYDNNSNHYCCEEHKKMICEKNNNVVISKLIEKVSFLFYIVELIFSNRKLVVIDQLKQIIPYLCLPISPCTQKSILVIIYKLVNYSKEIEENTRNKYITIFLKNKGLEHLLYLASISTIDIRYDCLKFFDVIHKYIRLSTENIEDLYFPYITYSLFPLNTPTIVNNKNESFSDMALNKVKEENSFESNMEEKKIDNSGISKHLEQIYKKNYGSNDKQSNKQLYDEEYWNIMKNENHVKNLNLPYNYIQFHSNEVNDIYVDNLYEYLLKWMLGRYNDEKLLIDDSDEIKNENSLNIILKVVMYSKNTLKRKCLQDIFMLCLFNKKNCLILLKNQYFYQWMLDLMIPFKILLQNPNFKSENESGIAITIIDLGVKIQTSILVNSILIDERLRTEPCSRLQLLFNWMYKLRKIGNVESMAATNLVRILLNNLVVSISEYTKILLPSLRFSVWENFLYIFLMLYEFLFFTNFDGKIKNKSANFEQLEKAEFFIEIIQTLPYKSDNKGDAKVCIYDNWIDKDLFDKVYTNFTVLWQEHIFKLNSNTSKSSNVSIAHSEEMKTYESIINKYIEENKTNAYIDELRVLMYVPNNNYYSENSKHPNVMRAIINMVCLVIKLAEQVNDIFKWVKELEKILLFIISACENARIDEYTNEAFLDSCQECVADCVIMSFNCLIDELNSPRRQHKSEEVTDIFKSTLRTIFIYMTLNIDRVNLVIQSNSNQKSNFLLTSINYIKGFVISKNSGQIFSPCWKIYNTYLYNKQKQPLFTISDIVELKSNKFIEIPERFNTESWIFAFQENPIIYEMIKSHICLNFFEKLIFSRIIEADNMSFNSDILNKEIGLVRKMLKRISISILESLIFLDSKFKDDMFAIFFKGKERGNKWKDMKKNLFQWRGKWCVIDEFLSNKNRKYKIANHYSSILSRPILKTIFHIQHSLPNFKHYDPINLFTDKKLKFSFEFDSDDSSCNSDRSQIFEKNPKKAKIWDRNSSLKSMMYYVNKDFTEFNDKYPSIERIMSFYLEIYEKNSTKIFFSISEHFINSYIKTNANTSVFEVCRVKITHHTGGKLLINNKEIIFICHYPDNKKSQSICDGALFNGYSSINTEKNLIYIINITSNLKYIHKRRYYYRKNSLEIFTMDNKSHFFKFLSKDERDNFCKLAYQYSNKSSPFTFDFNIDFKKNNKFLSNITEEWSNHRMSNFEYLMTINTLAGRSYNDLSQYPVFPWVIFDFKSENIDISNRSIYRDLSKPIGALGSEERLELFKSIFMESEKETELPDGRYFYSTHYSTPAYVTHFLARLIPFTYCCIELQGSSFDDPDRQFSNLTSTIEHCLMHTSDVRELIPEFFTLPEMFFNINNINFGRKQDSTTVSDVEIPKSFGNNAYSFVMFLKNAIESEYVSSNINHWVDLIFGYKQKGKDAENALNLFWKHTYEDEVEIENKNSEDEEYEVLIRKVEFGQTPSQIFFKPHLGRMTKELSLNYKIFLHNIKKLKVYRSKSESLKTYKNRKDFINNMVIKIKSLDNDRLICIYNNGTIAIFRIYDTPFSDSKFTFIKEQEKKYSDEKVYSKINEEDDFIMKEVNQNQPISIIRQGKYMFKGGYWDGKFLLFNFQNEDKQFYITDDYSRVTCIDNDCNEHYLFVGTVTGRLFIYNLDHEVDGKIELELERILTDHDSEITYLSTSNKINVLASVSVDKTCNLYTYPTFELFRVIKNEGFHFDYVFLSLQTIASVIMYSRQTFTFYSYNINGQQLFTEKDGCKYIFSPLIITDINHTDNLIYGTKDGDIIIRTLPFLKIKYRINLNKNTESIDDLPIKSFDLSKDLKSIFYWQLEDFNITVIRDPKENKNELPNTTSRSQSLNSNKKINN